MTASVSDRPLSVVVGDTLPFLRRHARALTGDQARGDAYAGATLEAILADADGFTPEDGGAKLALFSVFYRIWGSSGSAMEEASEASEGASKGASEGARGEALRHLSRLTPRTREALLLHTVEDFTLDEVALLLRVAREEAAHLVDVARREMFESVKGRVMVIEDEPLIAMDLEGLIETLGHEVTGIATTYDEAMTLGASEGHDLILADIRLADESSGIDAVNDLLGRFGDVPVIFITAYPERLLTGDRHEPAFLIAKPYTPPQVMSAISQAMFFRSTETLKV